MNVDWADSAISKYRYAVFWFDYDTEKMNGAAL